MTNEELAAWLNNDERLEGRQAVTANVVRQWVSWGVLPKATALGQRLGIRPLWERDPAALHQARRLAAIRKWNVVRENSVISQAFIEWGHNDIERARSALIAEFKRSRRLMFKSVTSSTDFPAAERLSSAKKKALIHQSGPLDIPFIKDRAINWSDIIVSALGFVRSGSGQIEAILTMALRSGIFPILVHSGVSNMITGHAAAAIQRLFAEPDEHDVGGEIHLIKASGTELLEAQNTANRWLFSSLPMMLDFPVTRAPKMSAEFSDVAAILDVMRPQLQALQPQITCGYWAISAYVVALGMIRNKQALASF